MRNIKNISNLIIKLNLLREDTQTTGQLSAAAAGTATDIPNVKLLTDCLAAATLASCEYYIRPKYLVILNK